MCGDAVHSGSATKDGPKHVLPMQGSAVCTKQMSWSVDRADQCDIVLAADILYDPGKPHLLMAQTVLAI